MISWSLAFDIITESSFIGHFMYFLFVTPLCFTEETYPFQTNDIVPLPAQTTFGKTGSSSESQREILLSYLVNAIFLSFNLLMC